MEPENQHSSHFPKLFWYCWFRGPFWESLSYTTPVTIIAFMFCAPYFARHSVKMLDVIKVFEGDDSILAHGFRRVSPSQEGWQGRTEQSTSWQSGSRERCMQRRVTARCRPVVWLLTGTHLQVFLRSEK